MSKSHPKVIKSREQYREYMDEFLSLFGKNLDNDQDMKDRYELLGVVIRDYESREFPPEKPSAIDAILFEMDERGLTRKDMVEYLGAPSKVSEVLSGKRGLSQAMIRKLHSGLGIPLDILIQSPEDLGNNEISDVIVVPSKKHQEYEDSPWDTTGTGMRLQELVVTSSTKREKSVLQ
ncbi:MULTISPECIES: helix-turn-helix domain-containing protein [Providencia]|uniref:helix-turn-helix domain-containing protein n=1 Tax=Providencia TaxID=586 RepID=UPI0018E4C968|nr:MULTISPECIES: hypothetical protein [Providencia]MBI6193325.1 hypothetical protein [Providencia rettgeri]MBQ0533983.1 hypothetical protein [Providencia huaxiensis]MBQ0588682.1 hypothetical protein [Providencia huaxiensis]MCG5369756.1 hypothetical protein [Providencia rettgeri]MDU7496073.1 hypothetical protein [Providencia rettgeri]